MVGYENILLEREPPIATITINRPQVRNALNNRTLEEISRALGELDAEDAIRVVILTGAGDRAFVSGADIRELEAMDSAQDGYAHSRRTNELLSKMQHLSKPIIAAVNGYALGGGNELAMASDIIVASDNARFGQTEVNLGIIPGFGGTQRLPRLIGRTRALEMILAAEIVSAREAFQMGLVNHVVPLDQLMEKAREIATTIAQKAPLAVALAKRAVYEGLDTNVSTGLDLEMTYFGLAIGSEDRREGTRAFLEKRAPNWQGR